MADKEVVGYNPSTNEFEHIGVGDVGTVGGSLVVGKDLTVSGIFRDSGGTIFSHGNPLAKAIRVAITAATSASNGIQQLSNTQNNFGTGNFAIQYKDAQPDWTPSANVVLCSKHDGTNGYILTPLATGILRTTINGTNFDSTSATGLTDGDAGVIDVDIIPATASAAGSVTYTLNGVQLGDALAISARVEKITNGGFDSDITGWTLGTSSQGTIAWNSGKMRVERTGTNGASGYQAIALAAGETLFVKTAVTYISGGGSAASISIREGAAVTSTALAGGTSLAAVSGNSSVSYTAPSAATVYVHLRVVSGNGIYDFDTVTSIDSATVDNTANLYVCGTSTTRSATEWYGHRLFNRAKTVAENLMMQKKGVLPADVGASQTAFYTTDFSAGTNSWTTASSTTVAGNIDGIGGKDNNLRVTTDGTSSARTVRSISLIGVKNGKFTFEVYRPSSNVTCTQVDVRLTVGTSTTGSISYGDYPLAADTWTAISIDIPVSMATNSATAISLLFADAAGATSNNTSGDMFYIASGGTFTQTGCTSELLAENSQSNTGQVLDTSGNKQHAMLPAAGASIIGKPNNGGLREVRWTNTWAGTSEAQYIGGVNQAIWPSNAKIESIVCVITGSDVQDFRVGDQTDDDRFVANTAGIAAGTNVMTLTATPYTDGTNLKVLIKPDTNCTMTVASTIRYTLLE